MKVYVLLITLEVIFALLTDKKSTQDKTKDVLVPKESRHIEQHLSKYKAINGAVEKAYDNALDLKQKDKNEENHDDIKKKSKSLGIATKNRNKEIKHKNTKIDLEKESPPRGPIKEANSDDYDHVQMISYAFFVGDGCATGLAKVNGICVEIINDDETYDDETYDDETYDDETYVEKRITT